MMNNIKSAFILHNKLSIEKFTEELKEKYNNLENHKKLNEFEIKQNIKSIIAEIFSKYNFDENIFKDLSKYFHVYILVRSTSYAFIISETETNYKVSISDKTYYLIEDNEHGIKFGNIWPNTKFKYYINSGYIRIGLSLNDVPGHDYFPLLFSIEIWNGDIHEINTSVYAIEEKVRDLYSLESLIMNTMFYACIKIPYIIMNYCTCLFVFDDMPFYNTLIGRFIPEQCTIIEYNPTFNYNFYLKYRSCTKNLLVYIKLMKALKLNIHNFHDVMNIVALAKKEK